jgi:hypothetical protein
MRESRIQRYQGKLGPGMKERKNQQEPFKSENRGTRTSIFGFKYPFLFRSINQ